MTFNLLPLHGSCFTSITAGGGTSSTTSISTFSTFSTVSTSQQTLNDFLGPQTRLLIFENISSFFAGSFEFLTRLAKLLKSGHLLMWIQVWSTLQLAET